MQVISLEEFKKCAPLQQQSPPRSAESSQRTETEPSSRAMTSSPVSSCVSTLPATPPPAIKADIPAAESSAPTPRPLTRSHGARRRVVPAIPDWIAEAFASDNYDSEELAVVLGVDHELGLNAMRLARKRWFRHEVCFDRNNVRTSSTTKDEWWLQHERYIDVKDVWT